MAPHRLRDQDWLDDLSNFAIWKAKILVVLEAYDLQEHVESVLDTPTNAILLAKHNEVATHAKRFIMDEVKDDVVPYIAEKKTTNEMWKYLTTLYQGKFVQKKMLLENQMRLFVMNKWEEINHFLFKLQTIWDQLIAMGVKVEDDVMVRTALNAVTNEWETYVQSILGRQDLPSWDDMWAILRQEEICLVTKRQNNTESSKVKKEEVEDAALTSKK